MNIVEIDIRNIESNPRNYRTTYHKISELADSIAKYGLLQNLVVIEYDPGKYHVHAGERRYRAIKMLCLQNDIEGIPRWPVDKPVPCVVFSLYGLSDYEENDKREKTSIWDEGARFVRELDDNGLDQIALAAKINKTQSYVSQCVRIYRGIHPTVRMALSKIGPDALPHSHLLQLVKLADAHGDPDEQAQIEKCKELLGRDRKRRASTIVKNQREQMLSRIRHLETKRVPLHAKPYVEVMVQYIKGERNRLKF